MIDHPDSLVPPLVAVTTTESASTEAPAGESTLPAPTAEQVQAADRVFSAAAQPHPLATLLGVATSFVLLRDVAVDTFDTTGADDEAKEKAGNDKDADPVE